MSCSYKVLLLTLWPDSLSTNEEQEALLQSKRGVGPTISEYCKWNGIVCNEAQSVTEISTRKYFNILIFL